MFSRGIDIERPLQFDYLIDVRDFSIKPLTLTDLILFSLSLSFGNFFEVFLNSILRLTSSMAMATENLNDSLPTIGQIYELRESVRRAFGIAAEDKSTKSSVSSSGSSVGQTTSTSSKSSRRKKPSRPETRPCLMWSKADDYCTVLLMTTFNDTNPILNEQVSASFSRTKKDFVKRLLAVQYTPPIVGRPSIRFNTLPSSGDILDLNKGNYPGRGFRNPYTTVYGCKRSPNGTYPTVFRRITWLHITIVFLRVVYEGIQVVYDRKRSQ